MTISPGPACSACGDNHVHRFVALGGVPVFCNVLLPTRAEALAAPRGNLDLGCCPDCGHVFNIAFDPAATEYTQSYENSLHFSPEFQRFAEQLADRLIARYDLHGKDIIDLGCGKGDFLKLICARGGNRGTGFDPSYVPDPKDDDPSSSVRFVREFYSERHTAYPVDLITCRHVLEHIPGPRAFLRDLRRSVGNRHRTAIYFEVPNVRYTLRDMGIWDLIYEHPSYFSAASLARAFAQQGFNVRALEETFGGQYLALEASPAEGDRGTIGVPDEDPEELRSMTEEFAHRLRAKVELWNGHVRAFRAQGRRVVVWGGGSKGVTFLNTTDAGGVVEFLVDINPRKHGMFVPGTGQQVIPPEQLETYAPGVVIIMNPLYREEIAGKLRHMGIEADILVA